MKTWWLIVYLVSGNPELPAYNAVTFDNCVSIGFDLVDDDDRVQSFECIYFPFTKQVGA